MSRSEIDQWLKELQNYVAQESELSIIQHLQDLVPEYEPDERWRKMIAASERVRGATAS